MFLGCYIIVDGLRGFCHLIDKDTGHLIFPAVIDLGEILKPKTCLTE